MPDFSLVSVVPILIVAVVFILIFSLFSMYRKVPQDKALVVTGFRGRRVITGGGGIVVPLLERTDIMSLENMQIDIRIDGALTSQGVGIIADGVAVVKIKSDKESILSAAEQFNTSKGMDHMLAVISKTTQQVLEGKLREIVSRMTVEEIYKDRETFASHVQGVAATELQSLGLELKVLTIKDIADKNGYLEALGKPRIAEVKRDAQIAEANATKETKIKTAEANREGEAARIQAETQIAEANRDKELKVQSYNKDQQTAKAEADLAYDIKANVVKKDVAETEMQVEIVRKQKEIELAEQEAIRKEKELEATVKKQADAENYRATKNADANRYKEVAEAEARARAIEIEGEAKAKAKRAEGMAEVEIIKAKGEAEALAMAKKAEAFKMYNDAAVTQMIIEKLPEIAQAIASPLAKTEKIVIVDNGSGDGNGKGASKVTGYITDIMAQLPETVEALTGMNVMDLLKKDSSKNIQAKDGKTAVPDVFQSLEEAGTTKE
ncbi:flotillin family protein [Pseudobacteroides cellulosolvens]|uniref:Band 7 protein n=1 Tax=Pseudobacteroides cellulosolvens ATCC 35603 = DSM 2933 TaxID=398512 RepID=A0A0L6JNN3_9FIRM|nr:SPFH domain-containing protein [Pseudobacteroides cellulosolvens]KNY27436.1 band 7 protein [Pseudobacteroides cellulosolvens ATCC 35603 = DSM 2933]